MSGLYCADNNFSKSILERRIDSTYRFIKRGFLSKRTINSAQPKNTKIEERRRSPQRGQYGGAHRFFAPLPDARYENLGESNKKKSPSRMYAREDPLKANHGEV